MCGVETTHHHNDDIIHMEGNGVITKKEDLSLGNFFDAISIPFNEMQIMNKKNGDLCNGKPGKVHLYIDGKENNEYRNYVPSRCDAQDVGEIHDRCNHIEVKFE